MSMVRVRVLVLSVLAALWGSMVGTAPAQAATHTFPGCGDSLQACIDDSEAGDTIQIATDGPIELTANIDFPHSLTLKAASGYRPVLKSEGQVRYVGNPPSSTEPMHFVISGLKFVNAAVDFDFVSGTGHSVTVRDTTVLLKNGSNGDSAIQTFFSFDSSGKTTVVDNTVRGDGTGISVTGDNTIVNISRNRVSTDDPSNSGGGIHLYQQGGGIGEARIADNVIYGVGGCGCGSPDALLLYSAQGSTLEADIVNNTIDRAHLDAVFVYADEGEGSILRASLYNNTITGSRSGMIIYPGIVAQGTANNTRGNTNGNTFLDPTKQNVQTIDVAPRFVDPLTGDYRLKESSALRNGGVTCMTESVVSRADSAENFRVVGSHVDIGAHEFGSTLSGAIAGKNKTGTQGPDYLTGTNGVDVICGLGGNDNLTGDEGSDFIFGGGGKDLMTGDEGRDNITGDEGPDRAFGEAGRDVLRMIDGIGGNDKAHGGPDDDTCLVDEGDTKESC